jgi:hypothetical protein
LKRKQTFCRRCKLGIIAGAILKLAGDSSSAQEALRTAVEGDQAYFTRNGPKYRPSDPLKAGPVYLKVGLGYSLEWNDNVNISSSSPEAVFIHRPQVDLQAVWEATKDSVLNFGMGIGYQKYMDHPDLDRMLISPNSELAWDIPVEDFVFTLSDRFLYSQDVTSQGGLSGTAEFPRIENTAGVRVRWMLDRYQLELGYAHCNFLPESATYDYLTRSSEQFLGRAACRLADATLAGLEASGSLTDYQSPMQQDNQSVSIGPFIESQLLADLRLSLRGGYVIYFQAPDPGFGHSGNVSSYYVGIDANHRLTDHVTHGMSVVREVQPSVNQGSELTEHLYVRYFVSWAFLDHATISADSFYEHGKPPSFGIEETYDRLGFGAGVNWQLLKHLSAGLAYRYITKDSNISTRDYNQNVVTLSANYQF